MTDLLGNLAAGARIAFFLRVRPEHFRATVPAFAVLALFNFGVWVVTAWARAGFVGEFDPSSIPTYLATITLVLAAALAVSAVCRQSERLVLLAVAFAAADPVFDLAGVALPGIAAAFGHAEALYLAFIAWSWIATLRAVVVCCGWQRPQVYRGLLAATAMTAIAFYVIPKSDVWLAPEDEEEEPGAALTDERLFHQQGQIIERDLAAIDAGRSGVAELYFVGFAPDGGQEVFLNEMRFVKGLFDERFGAAGRSIALASSETALDQLAIASTTNLARALGRVGKAMNADEDVLFLYITAHGDRAHRLSASQPPLELASLTPTALARMLQDSGIRYRVVVVSACYAGGFIEPLRDDNTIVITAAAQDRASFGCEEGRDFTYFGEAYFRDALAKTRSFTEAFEIARKIVAQREQAEKLEPSLPQMWVGPAIAARLKDLGEQPDQKR
jgi:hypothetical protein